MVVFIFRDFFHFSVYEWHGSGASTVTFLNWFFVVTQPTVVYALHTLRSRCDRSVCFAWYYYYFNSRHNCSLLLLLLLIIIFIFFW